MVQPATMANELTFSLTQEIRVDASLEATFAALLEQIGPHNETHEGNPLPMKLEARPGGRWYRDLGDENGHLWGHVQAIKRPTLLEITGPLFLSSGAISNLQYRLTSVDGGTLVTLKHNAIGLIPDDYRAGIQTGWAHILDCVRKAAERVAKK
jgi:uncharacterized protein YndB with AHSA1/START domain